MIAAVYQVQASSTPTLPRPTLRALAEDARAAAASPFVAASFALVTLSEQVRLIRVVVVWLATSRRARWARVALGVVACFYGYSVWREMPRAAERIRIVRAVDNFHHTHGRYPTSLAEAGVTPDASVFERCDYYVVESPTAAYLELSDGFLSTHWEYDFRRGRWDSFYD